MKSIIYPLAQQVLHPATTQVSRLRQKLHRMALGVLLACLVFPVTASAQSELAIIYEAAKAAYQAYQLYDGLNGDETLEALLAAIQSASQDIRDAMDAFEAAENLACSDAITIDFENFLNYTPENQQDFARDYLPCLTEAVNYMNVHAAGLGNVDRVGRGFNIVGSVLLFVYEYLGFETQGLLNLLEEGNQTILARLRPPCTVTMLEPKSPERLVRCTAYNGDSASGHLLIGSPYFSQDKAELEDEAARNTSYRIAKAMLEGEWLVSQGQGLLAELRARFGQFQAQVGTALRPEIELARPTTRYRLCLYEPCK